MFQFFESIAFIKGNARNITFHQERVDNTFKEFYPHAAAHQLENLLSSLIVNKAPLIKCRFTYNKTYFKCYLKPYHFKTFHSFVLIKDDSLDYNYKFTDRTLFNKHANNMNLETQILFIKNKAITDTTFTNLIFNDGLRWLTPAIPLLAGTMRSSLLESQRIYEESIEPKHLGLFKSFKLINALNSMEDAIDYPISLIQKDFINF